VHRVRRANRWAWAARLRAVAPDAPELRASDEQRDRAAREIREHFAAGRLTDEELSDRVQAAYSARTEAELERLVADLPKLPATRAEQSAALAERRSQLQRRLLQETGGGLCLLAVCVVIWAASGAHGQFWPIWVLLVVLIPLVRNGWRLYGPAPQLDRVERELEARERHAEHRASRRAGHHRRRL
jgi:Domain of unknown function (DUF1707)